MPIPISARGAMDAIAGMVVNTSYPCGATGLTAVTLPAAARRLAFAPCPVFVAFCAAFFARCAGLPLVLNIANMRTVTA